MGRRCTRERERARVCEDLIEERYLLHCSEDEKSMNILSTQHIPQWLALDLQSVIIIDLQCVHSEGSLLELRSEHRKILRT